MKNRILNRISKTVLLAMTAMLVLTVMSMSVTAIPTTAIPTLDPAVPGSLWYKVDVKVTLTATSTLPITATYYCLAKDCGAVAPPVGDPKWKVYTGPFTITAEGTNEFYYYSSDSGGNEVPSSDIRVKIDKTAPKITALVAPAADANGWHNFAVLGAVAGVSIDYTCTDETGGSNINVCRGVGDETPLPGIDPYVVTANGISTVKGRAVDNAGNVAEITNVVKKDVNAPTLSANYYSVTTSPTFKIGSSPTADFWFNKNVIANLKVDDPFVVAVALTASSTYDRVSSGVDPVQTTFSSEGKRISNGLPGTIIKDKAGNEYLIPTTTTAVIFDLGTKSGYINIDKTAPVITVTDVEDGKYYNADVVPNIVANDPNLKSVDAKLNGVTYDYAIKPPITGEGKYKLEITAEDIVGNTATPKIINFVVDKTAPVLTSSVDKAPNTNGWYNSNVKVTFKATDENDVTITSGVLTGVNTLDVPVTTEGKDQVITATATDKAGNSATPKTEKVSIDKTKPTISGAATPAPNADGWNDAAVSVKFTCADSLSEVKTVCGPDVVLSTEGAGQSVTGKVTDEAGNSNTVVVSGINIDLTAPTISITGVTDGGEYNAPVTPSIVIDAAASGEKTKSVILNGVAYVPGTPITTSGLKVLKVSVTDKAGRSASEQVTFTVKPGSAPDVLSYYRGLTGSNSVVDTQDLLKAADDWSKGTIPTGFSEPLSTAQLLKLADEWSSA